MGKGLKISVINQQKLPFVQPFRVANVKILSGRDKKSKPKYQKTEVALVVLPTLSFGELACLRYLCNRY